MSVSEVKDKEKSLPKKDKVDDKKIKENAEINKDAAEVAEKDKAEEVNETVNTDCPVKTKTSYQILNEPILAIRGDEKVDIKQIENSNQLAETIFKAVPDQLENVDKLAASEGSVDNEDTKNCLQQAANNCVASNQRIMNQPADGSVIMAPFNKYSVNAGKVNVNSDSSTFIRTPLMQTVSQNHQVTANNSYSVVADLQLKQSKTDLSLSTNQVVSTENSTTVATDSIASTANKNRQIGMEEYSVLGKDVAVSAESSLTQASRGKIESFAEESISSQSKNIGIISTTGSKSSFDAKADAPGIGGSGSSQFVIGNSSNGNDSFIVGNDRGYYNSTNGFNYSLSDKGTVISSKKATNIKGGSTVSVSGDRSSSFGKPGAKTFVGSINFSLPTFNLPKPLTVPSFPTIPKLKVDDLKNCIPKNSQGNDDAPVVSSGTSSTTTITGDTDINGNAEGTVSNGKNNPSSSLENPVEVPVTNPDSDKQTPPAVSEGTQEANKNISSFTRMDIYFEEIEPEEAETSENTDQKSDEEEVNEHDHKAKALKIKLTLADIKTILENTNVTLNPQEQQTLFEQLTKMMQTTMPEHQQRKTAEFLTDNTFLTEEELEDIAYVRSLAKSNQTINANLIKLIDEKYCLVGIGFLLNDSEFSIQSQILENANYKVEENKPDQINSRYEKAREFYLENTDKIRQGLNYLGVKQTNQLIDLGKDLVCGDGNSILENAVTKSIDHALGSIELKSGYKLNDPHLQAEIEAVYQDISTRLKSDKPLTASDSINYLESITGIAAKYTEDSTLTTTASIASATKQIFDSVKAEISLNESLVANGQGEPLSETQIFNLVDNGFDILAGTFDVPIINEVRDRLDQGKRIKSEIDTVVAAAEANDIHGLLEKDISTLAKSLIGPEHAKKLQNTFDVIISSTETFHTVKDLVDTVKQVPDVIRAMNDFKISKINQVKVIFQCLELFDKLRSSYNSVKGLYDRISDLGQSLNSGISSGAADADLEKLANASESYQNVLPENKDILAASQTIKKLELLPRMIQTVNTLNQMQPEEIHIQLYDLDQKYIRNISNDLNIDNYDLQGLSIKVDDVSSNIALPNLDCNINLNKNLIESSIEVVNSDGLYIQFKFITKSDFNDMPGRNDLIQMYTPEFKLGNGEIVKTYTDEYQFTPSVYNFVIEKYDVEANLGVASLADFNYSIIVQRDSGVLIEFNYKAWGKTLFPIIKDIYTLA